ncbi:MAG TPA: UDP-2,4-diacetamido-2,4,6-trideoxy-beta-L-altropyranose hydrolase [Micavibrio sp.]|nr:UDP-2,4-diacetamido-2,4,6-trideoxy-beta-L-altropyranose hydrolase [Micavibrio sp.]
MGMNAPLTAVFRSDASSTIGSGHIMRCLTLAEGLKTRGWHCIFTCSKDTLKAVSMLAISGFEVIEPEETGALKTDLLIVDHYGLDSAYESAARAWSGKIAVLDDLADRLHDCDLLIDQTYGRSAVDYQNLTPAGCRIITGSQYMLLRPQFAMARAKAKKRRSENNPLKRVLVAVGSLNYNNIVPKIIEGLMLVSDGNLQIDVVLSSGAENMDDVRRAISSLNSKGQHSADLHLDVQDMAALMVVADIAIGAGGTTTWERCCLGLPTLMVELADNQIPTIQALEKAGAIIPMGHAKTLSAEKIAEYVQNVAISPDMLNQLAEASFEICDGMGLERSLIALEDICFQA